jgi:hypothetical protein
VCAMADRGPPHRGATCARECVVCVQQQMMHMQWLPFTEGAVWIPGKLQGRAVLAACSVRTAFEQHLSISCSVCMRGIVQTCGQGWLWRELRTCLQAGAGGGFDASSRRVCRRGQGVALRKLSGRGCP